MTLPSDPSEGDRARLANGRLRVGRVGEDAALADYVRRGFRVLDRNWRCALGELDLVVCRGRLVVFCEVKARRGSGFGGPHDAVTWQKQRKLRALADAWLANRSNRAEAVRFDVASVSISPGRAPSVFVFEDAF